MTVRVAVVKKGQLLLEEPLPFPDGTKVQVQVTLKDGVPTPPQKKADEVDPLLFAAEHAVDTGIPDMAEQHDHYAYGSPKRTE